jgi:hypothetical protein
MALVSLTVRGERTQFGTSLKRKASEVQAIDDSCIKRAVPSVCKNEAYTDGLVNSKVTADAGDGVVYLFVTETVSAISALS